MLLKHVGQLKMEVRKEQMTRILGKDLDHKKIKQNRRKILSIVEIKKEVLLI